MRTCVFLGPSLPKEEATLILNATYYPPIKRGDLEIIKREGFRRAVIIDGIFFSNRSVSLTEIRDAIKDGIEMWGASSMGALRAVEAESLGMRGVGQVFEAYRSGKITDDDEVALVFVEHNGMPVSEPLINLREALYLVKSKNIITAPEFQTALARLKKIHYSERTLDIAFKHLEKERAHSLVSFLGKNRGRWDLKRKDAVEVLTMVREYGEEEDRV